MATTQKINVIHLPNYFKEKGIIFSEDYVVGIDMNGIRSRYTPTMGDIIKAEEIFTKKYNELRGTNVDIRKFFSHWVRQYVGLVDDNGNQNIIVQLLENGKPRKLNRKLGKHWETEFVIYFSDPNPGIGILFKINIDTGYMSTKL